MKTIYEQFPPENIPGLIKCTYIVYKKSFSRIHWHKNIELIYIIEPTVIYLNGEEVLANKDEIIVIKPNVLHDFKAPSDSNAMYHCIIVDESLCDFLELGNSDISIKQIIKDKTASELIKKIIKERREENPYYISAIKTLTGELLIHLYRNFSHDNSISKFNDKNLSLAKEIIGYIDNNYKNPITLDDICVHTQYSKYYVIHIFKKITGFTVSDYINMVRITEGARLLKNSKLSIGKIAAEVGFSDQSYFSKMFKKQMGCTPTVYLNKE